MSDKNKKINLTKNKKHLEGWKIAVIVISIVIVIGIIILLLFIFVFNKDINSDIPIFNLVFDEPNITKIDPKTGFGLILPKQNLFINSSGTMLAFGNPYYLNSNGDIGAILFYEKNILTGDWEVNSKKLITSTYKVPTSFGNSIWGSDDFKYIYIAIRAIENNSYTPRIGFAILQENGTYKLYFNQFNESNITRSVYCSSDSNDKNMFFVGTNPASILFGILNENSNLPKIDLQGTDSLPASDNSGTIVTGGGGTISNYIASGFGGTSNSIIIIYNRINNKWTQKYVLTIQQKTNDNLFMNQFSLSINYLTVTGQSSFGVSDTNLLLYGLTENNPTLLTSTSFTRGTVPIIKIDQLINEYSSSVSMDGVANIIAVGTQTKDILIYTFTRDPNKLNLFQTISQSSNIKCGLATNLSANGNVLAFTTYDPSNFNYGLQIYEKNLIEGNESN